MATVGKIVALVSAVQTWSMKISWRQWKEVVRAGLWNQTSVAEILALFTC